MYLVNGPADYYHKRIRDNIKIVLMGCSKSFESCFCVSTGTNISENLTADVVRSTMWDPYNKILPESNVTVVTSYTKAVRSNSVLKIGRMILRNGFPVKRMRSHKRKQDCHEQHQHPINQTNTADGRLFFFPSFFISNTTCAASRVHSSALAPNCDI